MRTAIGFGIGICMLIASLTAMAQEMPKAEKYTNVDWYMAMHIRFEPKHAEEAVKIIFDHFVKAGENTGGEAPYIFEYSIGSWDMALFFPMKEGPSALEWKMDPEDEKWFAALAALEGGPEKAMELYQEYLEMVDEYEIGLVRKRK